jgi:hypothetical protein
MGQRIAHEGEHRRGLVLGLTLAEVLILLLFLLLLALGTRLHNLLRTNNELQVAIAELGPLIAEIRARGGPENESVEALVKGLARVQQLEKEMSGLAERNAKLEAELAETTQELNALEPIVRAASRIRPDDPPAVLKRAMAMVEAVGLDMDPDRLKSLSEMVTKEGVAQRMLATAQEESDRFRRERDNLMRRGNGLTYPSCWTAADGQTEYIFDVTIRDAGLTVRDIAPSGRAADPAWKYVESFPRGTEIDEHRFFNSTKRLFDWSKEQNCRFYSVIRDATGPTSKERYKQLRMIVENHFYPLHLSVNASGPGTRAAERRPNQLPGQTRPEGANVPPPMELALPARPTQPAMGGPLVPVPPGLRQ